jgi:hypothetical protein
MFFSAGMPLLLPIGAAVFTVGYWIDKVFTRWNASIVSTCSFLLLP